MDSGDVNIVTVQGKMNLNAGGDFNLKVGGNYTLDVEGNITETAKQQTTNVDGTVQVNAGDVDINADPINLN